MPSLEQPDRPTLEDHVHRPQSVGSHKSMLRAVGIRCFGPIRFQDSRIIVSFRDGACTLPELVHLVHYTSKNPDTEIAQKVIEALVSTDKNGHPLGIFTDTGVLYVTQGMFVQDIPNPYCIRGRMDAQSLSKRIVSTADSFLEKEFSSVGGDVRFTTYEFDTGENMISLHNNRGFRALVGGQENANKLLEASKSLYPSSLPDFLAINSASQQGAMSHALLKKARQAWLGFEARRPL